MFKKGDIVKLRELGEIEKFFLGSYCIERKCEYMNGNIELYLVRTIDAPFEIVNGFNDVFVWPGENIVLKSDFDAMVLDKKIDICLR